MALSYANCHPNQIIPIQIKDSLTHMQCGEILKESVHLCQAQKMLKSKTSHTSPYDSVS